METDGKGFDRVRQTEIGKKYFKLSHFEEVNNKVFQRGKTIFLFSTENLTFKFDSRISFPGIVRWRICDLC